MRAFVLLVEFIIVASISVWLFFQDGHVLVRWGEDSVNIQLGAAFLGFVVLFLAVYFIISVWRFIVLFPTRMFERAQKMRPAKGLKALTQAAISTALDEYDQAKAEAHRFERFLGENPVHHVIVAYNLMKEGKYEQALAECDRMKCDDDGNTLAWALQARIGIMRQQDAVALENLTKLYKLHQNSPWVIRNLIKYAYKSGMYDKAEAALRKAEKLRLYSGQIINEAHAFLNYERSKDSSLSLDDKEAMLERAHRLAPELPKIAIQYSKVLRMRDKERRARKVLENAWAQRPDTAILEEFLVLESSTEEKDILADIDRLMTFNSSDLESYLSMARVALKHKHWGRARAALHDAEEEYGVSQELCHLFAQLELMEHGNQAGYREWMEKALNSPHITPAEISFEKIIS